MRNKRGALLKGLVHCTACNRTMVHTCTAKKKRLYRYYVCGGASKNGYATCPTLSVAAKKTEDQVVDCIRKMGSDPALQEETLRQVQAEQKRQSSALKSERKALLPKLRRKQKQLKNLITVMGGNGSSALHEELHELETAIGVLERRATEIREDLTKLESQTINKQHFKEALSLFDPIWHELFPREKERVMHLLVRRIGYGSEAGELDIAFHAAGVRALATEIEQLKEIEGRAA